LKISYIFIQLTVHDTNLPYMKKIIFLYFLLQLCNFISKAQTDTTFWFAAPDVSAGLSSGYNLDRPIILRISSYQKDCNVTISQPANGGMVTQTVFVPANTTQSVDLTNWINSIECTPGNVVQNKGLKITSDNNISVYYDVNAGSLNPELYSLKGRNALGTQFYISSQYLLDNGNDYLPLPYSSFNIVATQDNTVVTITPTHDIVGHSANIPFTITLNAGQTYAAIAASQSAAQHLQGSAVSSTKPIAITLSDDLLAGAAFNNGGCRDLAGDQTIPVNITGTDYIAIQTKLYPPYDQVFVTATQNNTLVYQNGALVTTLNAGQSTELSVSNSSTYIQTSLPSYAYQLAGVGCEVSAAILPKINCTGSNSVSVARSSAESFGIVLLVQNGGQNSFLINGASGVITGNQFNVVPNTGGLWYEANIDLSANYGVGNIIKVTNSAKVFQMGAFQGGVNTGASFGYFSDYNTFQANAFTTTPNPCIGSPINLFADTISSASYSWAGPNNFTSNAQNPVIGTSTLANTGKYTVTVTVPGCGSSTDTVSVVVKNCSLQCNNWLNTPSLPSYVDAGQINITGTQLTIEATINRTQPYVAGTGDGNEGDVVSKHLGPPNTNYLLRPTHAYITTSNGFFGTPDVCPIELNKTYHIAMVYDGNTLKYYRDGFLMSQVPASGNLYQNTFPTRIGLYTGVTLENFLGYTNEVRIWNVARTQTQLRAYMNSSLPNPTTQTGLVAYYEFNDLLNKQGNGTFNGTLSGAASINATNPNCTLIIDSCCIPTTHTIDTTICKGNSYLAHSTTGTYIDTIKNSVGCDSIRTVHLTVITCPCSTTNNLIINTGYNPTTNTIIPAGQQDPNWLVSSISPLMLAVTGEVATGSNAWAIPRNPNWISNANSNYISSVNNGTNGYNTVYNGVYTMTVTRTFKTVIADNITINLNIAGDNYVSAVSIDGGNSLVTGGVAYTDFSSFKNYTISSTLPSGTHTISITLLNRTDDQAYINNDNYFGLNVWGSVKSNTSTNSIIGSNAATNCCVPTSSVKDTTICSGNTYLGHSTTGTYIIDTIKNVAGCDSVRTVHLTVTNCTGNCNNWLHISNYSTTDYVSIGDLDVTGNQITVEAEFNADSLYFIPSNISYNLVSKHTDPSNTNYLLRPVTAEITTTNGFYQVVACDYTNQKTHHAALVYDGSTLKFYRNGFLMGSKPATGNLVTNDLVTKIGNYAAGTQPGALKGYINEVRIWNVARTQAQIKAYMNTSLPNPATQSGLLAYYIFNDLNNKQGNPAWNGTLNGAAAINQTNPNCTLVIDSCCTPLNFDFYYNQDICNPLSVQFYAAGSDSLNPYFSFGDGTFSNGNTHPTHTYSIPGSYTIRYSVSKPGSCIDTLTKSIVVTTTPADIIITPDTTICYGSTKQLRTKPGLNFCWSPTTYLNNPTLANPTTAATKNITYYFTSSVQGNNLITNGTFDAGNTGFTSQYVSANPNTAGAQYFIGNSPNAWNPGMSHCSDHTGASGNGNMMLVNGAAIPNVVVWSQTINVLPNTNYAFSAWAQNLTPNDPTTSSLQFSINGNLIGNVFRTNYTTCIWGQFYSTWNSGNNTTATISLVNNTLVQGGNDFALDDISFSPVYIQRDSVIITVDSPNVKTNKDTSICIGSSVQLTATGANTYSWTQSSTSLSATNIYNPVATPTTNSTYIVAGTTATGCIGKDTVNIAAINCIPQFCTGTLGAPIVNITFGSGVTNPGGQLSTIVPSASTSYSYQAGAVGQPPANVVLDGFYTIVNQVPSNPAWFFGATDHTGNPNGYMAFFNAAPTPGNFYTQTVTGLCPGTTYEFAAWIANVLNPAKLANSVFPNITFNILNPSNQAVLGTFNTGDIPTTNSMTWKQYGSVFTMPVGLSSVTLVLANNNIGGSAQPGNDLAIDDITFRPCGPTTTAALSTASMCQTDSVNLLGTVSTGLHNPAYQWQISIDTGKTFTDIAGATSLTYKESGLNPGIYQFQLLSAEVGNIGSSTCRFVSNNVQLTVNSCSQIINTYTPVLALNSCENKITVEDASTFNIGDTVVLMQMKGAVIDTSNTANFGTITDYRNAGNYEFNYVKSKTGNVILLLDSLTKSYDIPDGKVQLIRVPYYNNLTVTSTLTCLPWDGSKGGVLIVNAKNTVTLQGNIDVSGKGLNGGNGLNTQNLNWFCSSPDYYYPSGSIEGAKKGEGIALISTAKSNGRGALANGGGGGNQANSGGGGGGNGGVGGIGGNQYGQCSPMIINSGIGGYKLDYGNNDRVFLGGGGGNGEANNPPPNSFSAFGGNGGGIILINAATLNSVNNYTIKSNGDSGLECNNGNCWEGMGGGGAGGSILLNVNTVNNPSSITLQANGGKGANASYLPSQAAYEAGPGGGGAGGVVSFRSSSVPAGITINSIGGLNGVDVNFSNDAWGAKPGQNGINLLNLKVSIDSVSFKKNIDSVRITTSDSSCSGFYYKGLAYTNTSPIKTWQWTFDDGGTASTQNTSHNFTTSGNHIAKLIATDANGCMDSAVATVTVNTVLNFDFTFNQNVCNPLSIQFDGIGTDSLNSIYIFGDGTSVTNNVHPVHVYPSYGNYTIKYSVRNALGCVDTVTKVIAINPVNANVILTPDTTICYGDSKLLRTNAGTEFCWAPVTYLNDATLANPTTSTPQNITYYFTTKNQGANIIKNGDFESGNTNFITTYTYCNSNNCLFPLAYNGYAVGADASFFHTAFVGKGRGGTGNFMVVNGGYDTLMVWQQTVPVQKNTLYNFSAWVSSLYTQNFAPLQVSVNNVAISTITAPSTRNTWIPFSGNWVSSDTTTLATIRIVCTNTSQAIFLLGCDFGLDDVSFNPVYLQKDSVIISVDTPSIKTIKDTAVCQGTPVQLNTIGATTYSWTPTTGLRNPTSASPVATPFTSTKYIVTGINQYGCSAKDSVTLTINAKPVIVKSNDTSICKNTSVQLSVSGGGTYQWQYTPTLNNLTTATPIATPVDNETYYVTVTGTNSCVNTDSVRVSFRALPYFTVSPDQSVCTTAPVQLSASGGDKYLWSPASAVNNAAIANPLTNITNTTTYTVQITESTCNNKATLTTTVTLLPPLDIQLSKSNDLDCSIGTAQLLASGADWYQWSPATGLNDTAVSNPIASSLSTVKYIVKGSNAEGCVGYDSIIVYANYADNKSGYYMPNAFTPNGDGMNDCYGIKYWGLIEKIDFSIYDRWGNMVFHTTNIGDCWNGTYKGLPANADNYVYIIKAITACGQVQREGNVILVR